jgi:hypothetical protein
MPYHHVTPKEQYVIAHMTMAGFSLKETGRFIRNNSYGAVITAYQRLDKASINIKFSHYSKG